MSTVQTYTREEDFPEQGYELAFPEQEYRRSSRLFDKFVNRHAERNPGSMYNWIHNKLVAIDNVGPGNTTIYGSNKTMETHTIEIYCTVLYHERINPRINDEIFESSDVMILAMITKLLEFINTPGLEWGSLWANKMFEEYAKIRMTRFH